MNETSLIYVTDLQMIFILKQFHDRDSRRMKSNNNTEYIHNGF
jgi:hypothetical protein